MAFSYTRDVGDGSKTIFSLSFAGQDNGYIASDNIHVYVNGIPVPFTLNVSDPNKVYLATAPAVGADVLIRRQMPQSLPYADFQNGQPFSQDTLNKSFLQQLYLTQELLDGFLPDGFYYKQDVNMGGFNIKNLGDAADPDDAVKKADLDSTIDRVESLENGFQPVASGAIPWRLVAAGGELTLNPPYSFSAALLFINGVTQTFGAGRAYTVENNTIKLSEPLLAGDDVFIIIGTLPQPPADLISQSGAELLSAAYTTGVPVTQVYHASIGASLVNALVLIGDGVIHLLPSPVTGTITAINWPDVTIS